MNCVYREMFKRVGVFSHEAYDYFKSVKNPNEEILKLISKYEHTSNFVNDCIKTDDKCPAMQY